jgi:micrococcal nuclease
MYEYNCKIVRVIDGDSIIIDIDLGFSHWIHGESIRLYGVDTPECRTRDAEKKAAGLLAKEFVEEALHVGETYTLTTKEKGKFGRYLGVIMLSDKTSINAALSEAKDLPFRITVRVRSGYEEAHKANYEILKEKGLL